MNVLATSSEQQRDVLSGTALPSGYKRTIVGLIPSDWDVEPIGTVAKIRTGARNTQDREGDGLYPFFVRSQTVERINSYAFDGEAVLTAGDGVGTGKVFHYVNGKFDYHQRVYSISDFHPRLNGKYFYFYFSTHFYDRIASMTAKSSVDSVRMDMIADMPIPLPPEPEQRAIAGARRATAACGRTGYTTSTGNCCCAAGAHAPTRDQSAAAAPDASV